jgi:hypothetical protein
MVPLNRGLTVNGTLDLILVDKSSKTGNKKQNGDEQNKNITKNTKKIVGAT